MEVGVNTIYVLRLPSATQIGLEHEEKNPKYLFKKSLKKMIFFSCSMVFYLAKH